MTRHHRRLLFAVAAVALSVPLRAVVAQGARTCEVEIDRTGGVGRQITVTGGWIHHYGNGGIWAHCIRQITNWYSDSVAWYQERDRFDMVGNMLFRDESVELTADRASYFLSDERLEAYGNAVLRNLKTGSVLRGPNLVYRRAVEGVRDTSEWVATRRPTIEYRSGLDSADTEPYVIVADRVRLLGEHTAHAVGTVTIDRSDFTARSDSAVLNTDVGAGTLVGHAGVTGGDSSSYSLNGRVIEYRLDDNALTWAQAEGGADATSDDWRIVADTNRLQRGNAWGSDSVPARAMSVKNRITADSLVIEAPGQELSAVRGIGNARATSKRDSVDNDVDWVVGDTVVARFDSTASGRRALVRLDAVGNARAHYRVYPEGRPPGALPDISYSRGDRIIALFANEQVRRVDIIGQTDGVYLEAPRGREPS